MKRKKRAKRMVCDIIQMKTGNYIILEKLGSSKDRGSIVTAYKVYDRITGKDITILINE